MTETKRTYYGCDCSPEQFPTKYRYCPYCGKKLSLKVELPTTMKSIDESFATEQTLRKPTETIDKDLFT